MRPEVWLLLLVGAAAAAADKPHELGGHTKLRFIGTTFPSDSVFRQLTGRESLDLEGDLRLNFKAVPGRWTFSADYQLVGLYGDRVEYTRDLPPAIEMLSPRLPDDRRRLFDFTKVMHDRDKAALLHRLDRFWAGYASEKAVVRMGRQAISWGNGLFYAPMDLVNPFDPAAIDTEYKAGDDMVYLQYLQDSGNDVQAAAVVRRNLLDGEVESEQATVAVKYHGFVGNSEYDLLVANHYDDLVLGLGGTWSPGGAVLRGDLVVTDTDSDTYAQLVANWSYSWTWRGRNMSGAVEYHFNGFGQHDGRYDPESLAQNPDLLERLARGETFTLGRHYLAGSVLIEMSPLWMLTPTVLANVTDPSALLQIVTSYSLSDNMTFLGSLNVPVGPGGSEFGGIPSGNGLYLSTGAGVFAQLAWYF
ncbi:MAG: hypothetical protein OEQ30_00660 [Gammaproteobacteria bacterium]|jgi:hypothetical protein|nr:hypothetical protein [Gammaproteobacteria bacterium]MDH3848370.1 hypothetical protein [Gammaproteobacteria bacterium]MDH3863272.1 hypothetical protein [Gammaproteobacteria bacterium]MDH3904862.1 hypothetical protein [Gammaproteobacteria bacterium]MDH3953412.1 hypothetical protein [Gammaproteobacteria bacterium]